LEVRCLTIFTIPGPSEEQGIYNRRKNSEDPPVNVFEDRLIMTFDYFYGESHANQQGSIRRKTYKVQEWEFSKKAENTTIRFYQHRLPEKLMQENEREEKRIAASLRQAMKAVLVIITHLTAAIGCLPRIQPMRRYW